MLKIRRVNFFAGPGVGKSTTASRVFSELKARGHDVEFVPEYIKTWAHEKRVPKSYDQLYVFSKQLRSEDVLLRSVPTVVTDSPLLMNTAYSTFYGFRPSPHIVCLAQEFDRDFPALNFFIDRTVAYQADGRYQTYEQAVEFDAFLLKFLHDNMDCDTMHHVTVDQFDKIMALIEGHAVDGTNS